MPRRARLGDLPGLVRIMRASTRARPLTTDLWLLGRVVRRGWVRVLRDGHGPAGFSIRDGGRLHGLYVHPRAQGRGIGRALLGEAQAQVRWLDLWVLVDNTRARRFYTRNGFAEKARAAGQDNDEGRPEILMVWPPERRREP